MGHLFNEILTRPILNLLVFLYSALGNDFGLAIITATALVRLITAPLSLKTARSQQALAKLTPEIEELRRRHKDDPTVQSQAIMRLYRERNISPLSGCLPLLIQLPIIIALYRALAAGFHLETSSNLLYEFLKNPGRIGEIAFGSLNIAEPNHLLALVAGTLQFVQTKLAAAAQPVGPAGPAALNTQMLYLFPAMLVVISWNLSAGITLYFITSAIVAIVEQYIVRRLVKTNI